MKFKFCGGLDCPDWLLAGIAELSNVSTIKLKEISQKVSVQRLLSSLILIHVWVKP